MWPPSSRLILLLSHLFVHQIHRTQSSNLIPEHVAKLEIKQFQLEMDDFIRQKHEEQLEGIQSSRVKRTVIYNSEAPMDVTLVFSVPITVILPVLQNVFTNLNWDKILKWKRSVDDEEETHIGSAEESSIVQPHLDKIRGYFELMRVPERVCQERAICEFSADPNKYYPVSELVLNRIRNPSLPPLTYPEEERSEIDQNETSFEHTLTTRRRSLFRLFTDAAEKGLTFGEDVCITDFSGKCPYSVEKRLDMPSLQFWNLLSSLLRFNIRENVNSWNF